jgi:5-methylcytosine-specific restriction endonuclease McrA
MPSGKNYKRDYEQEYKTESETRKRFRAQRNSARRAFEAEYGEQRPSKDVDHIHPLSKGGSNDLSNLRAVSQRRNRSFPRTRKARMK